MSTPYQINRSTVPTYTSPAYVNPYGNFRPKLTPEDMNRQNAMDAARNQATVNAGLTNDRNEYASNMGAYGGALESMYMDQANGGWGLTPEQQATFMDEQGLSTFNPQGQMDSWRGDTANWLGGIEQGATDSRAAARDLIGGLYAGVDPIEGYNDKIQGWSDRLWSEGTRALDASDAGMRNYLNQARTDSRQGGSWSDGGGLDLYRGSGPGMDGWGSGWSGAGTGGMGSGFTGFITGGGGVASVGGVDMSGLDLDPNFLRDYRLTPEMKQAWENLATQGAGGRYRAGLQEAQRGMAAAGIANPYADAAMRERYEMREGQAMDDARLAAIVGAEGEEDRRLLDIENLRSGNERTRAQLNTQTAIANAGFQDSAYGRDFSAGQNAQSLAFQARENAANRELQAYENAAQRALQARLAGASEAAVMERYYKELDFELNKVGLSAEAGMGDRRVDFIGNATGFDAGQWNQREQNLSDRQTNAATVGFGAQLDNEQRIANSRNSALGDIATGTQGVYNNINATGLDYSNARSQRAGSIYDFNNANRQAGVAGIQGMYDTNAAARQNTWANQINNNANQGQLANESVGQLGGFKTANPSAWQQFTRPLLGGIGASIGGSVGFLTGGK